MAQAPLSIKGNVCDEEQEGPNFTLVAASSRGCGSDDGASAVGIQQEVNFLSNLLQLALQVG